jgi:hypothetical protein
MCAAKPRKGIHKTVRGIRVKIRGILPEIFSLTAAVSRVMLLAVGYGKE